MPGGFGVAALLCVIERLRTFRRLGVDSLIEKRAFGRLIYEAVIQSLRRAGYRVIKTAQEPARGRLLRGIEIGRRELPFGLLRGLWRRREISRSVLTLLGHLLSVETSVRMHGGDFHGFSFDRDLLADCNFLTRAALPRLLQCRLGSRLALGFYL